MVLKPFKTIFCVYPTMQSKFKDFVQIKRTVAIDKHERKIGELFLCKATNLLM